jgi:hypothetical protein
MRLTEIELPKITDVLMYSFLAQHGDIEWHPTTPKKFQCEPGCVCCCAPTYYFESEVKVLPEKIQSFLMRTDIGVYVPDMSRGCCFHTPPGHPGHGCLIHGYEPLRCQLYPFLPIFVQGKIIMMCDSLCDVFNSSGEEFNSWHICYGLDRGKSIVKKVEGIARAFLLKTINEAPYLLSGLVFNKAEDLLCQQRIEHHSNRKYEHFIDALPEIISSMKKR